MATLQQTRGSGSEFEREITRIISQYTSNFWRNIRVETLLTASGTTEIDILFCYKDIVFIVEAKRVATIIGDYGSKTWSFIGSKSPNKEVREYTALNVITQNNIHVRSFKDMFHAYFKEWIHVMPIIVVPNNCTVSQDISGNVHTVAQLDDFLSEVSKWSVDSKIHRRVASLVTGDNIVIHRPDFEVNPTTGLPHRTKVV